MAIEKETFVNYKTEEEKEQDRSKVFTIRLNAEEIAEMEECAKLLRQEKFGSTAKQLIRLGQSVLQDKKIAVYIDLIYENERRNQRLGIAKVKPKF